MSTRNSEQKTPPRGVLDPAWEDDLRRGQQAEGELGSLEPELAIVRLLRHARAPEAIAPPDLDALWSDAIAPAISPPPWWRRRWLWGALPAFAAAAAVLFILRTPDDRPSTSTSLAEHTGPSTSQLLAKQFAQLEHHARQNLDSDVDDGRTLLRNQLLAMTTGDKP